MKTSHGFPARTSVRLASLALAAGVAVYFANPLPTGTDQAWIGFTLPAEAGNHGGGGGGGGSGGGGGGGGGAGAGAGAGAGGGGGGERAAFGGDAAGGPPGRADAASRGEKAYLSDYIAEWFGGGDETAARARAGERTKDRDQLAKEEGFRNHGEKVRTYVAIARALGYPADVGALQANAALFENGEAEPVGSTDWRSADLDVNGDGIVDKADLAALGIDELPEDEPAPESEAVAATEDIAIQ